MGRVVTVTLPGGNTITTIYSGVETTVTDQVGRKREREVDGLGRMIRVAEQDPGTGLLTWDTNYSYDMLNNLTQVDQGGQIRKFKYDSLSRLTFEKTPEQDATINDGTGVFWSAKYDYTIFNAMLKQTDARGVETHYSYDTLNRLGQVSYTGLSGGGLPSGIEATSPVTITYKNPAGQAAGKGQIDIITDGSGTESYQYDSLGRVTSKNRTLDGNQYITGYEYNQIGQASVMIYPSGKRVRMNHDGRGRLRGIDRVNSSNGVLNNYLSTIDYNEAQQVTGLKLNNDAIIESYEYDPQRLQLTRQQATKQSTMQKLMDLTYGYQAQAGQSGAGTTAGNSGQLMSITGTINSVSRDQAFTYDNLGRLKTATGWGVWLRRYDYDRWGNRTAVWNAASRGVNIVKKSSHQVWLLFSVYGLLPVRSEVELQTELNLSWPARPYELAEDRAGRKEIVQAREGRVRGQPVGQRLRDVVEGRLVEDVEELRAELYAIVLFPSPVLGKVQVRVVVGREPERRAPFVAYLADGRRKKCQRVDEIGICARHIPGNVFKRVAYPVGPVAARTARARGDLKHAVERQPRLYRGDPRDLPPAEYLIDDRHRKEPALCERQFVVVTGDEHVRPVETRHGPLYRKVGAYLRQVDGVAVVGRVGDVLRERVGDLSRQPVRGLQPERAYQRVVARGGRRLPVGDGAVPLEGPRAVDAVVRVVGSRKRRVAARYAASRCENLLRRGRVYVDGPNQVIARRPGVA
jgi:YD repeat-containing protein